MELTENKYFKWIVLATIICVASSVFSSIIPFLVIIVTITIAVLWIKKGPFSTIAPYLISVFSVLFLYGTMFTLLFVLVTLPTSIALSLFIKQKKRMFDSVLLLTFLTALGSMIFISLISMMLGQNIITYLGQQFKLFLSLDNNITYMLYLSIHDQAGFLSFAQTGGLPENLSNVSITQIQSSVVNEVEQLLPVVIPSAVVLFSFLNGFFSFYISNKWLKKHNTDVVPVAMFKDLRIPRKASFALSITIIGFYILGYLGYSLFINAFSVLLVLFILIYSIQGCALFIFLYKSGQVQLVVSIFLIILGILLNIMFWVGLLEGMFRVRERITQSNSGGKGL